MANNDATMQQGTPEEEALSEALEELMAEAPGDNQRLSKVLAKYPDLAEEIQALWFTAHIADEAASKSIDEDSTMSGASQLRLPDRIGDYELRGEIGRGGMGAVIKARQLSLDRVVALKMILRGVFASDEDLVRLRTEAEAAARLGHPNIVDVYEVGEYEGQPFFSMKYIEGQTLSRRLADGPLPSREAARVLLPIVQAIAEAHRHGILHRDIKPANILIARDGTPYITDFGLAKRVAGYQKNAHSLDSVTQSGAILGTPSFMPPEQAAGKLGELGKTSDVYSLGAVLYAMLTARPPFQASSAVDTVLLVLEQEPVPPRTLNPKADSDLEMIAMKCLQKPADLRYSSADELAADLEAYLRHEPISAKSSSVMQVMTRALRETHHAVVLENWGLLWMWHGAVLLLLCFVTNGLSLNGVSSRWPYLSLWVLGLGVWAGIFWSLRRRAGPITFVERQIAHVWAGSMIGSTLLYLLEAQLGLEVLELSPILGAIAGMVFLVKAGILSGSFYVQAIMLFATAVAMAGIRRAGLPDFGISLFGIVTAGCFFFPGLKYYRQKLKSPKSGA
jgi:serine/threonine-protein kinase